MKNSNAVGLVIVAFLLGTGSSAFAGYTAFSGGIDVTYHTEQGNASCSPAPPLATNGCADFEPGAMESPDPAASTDYDTYLYAEVASFVLSSDLPVDIDGSDIIAGASFDNSSDIGDRDTQNPYEGLITSGTEIDSWLLHFDPESDTGGGGGNKSTNFSITFDETILGIIVSGCSRINNTTTHCDGAGSLADEGKLYTSDSILGLSGTTYQGSGGANRGALENGRQDDSIDVDASDNKTLHIQFATVGTYVEEIRIVTTSVNNTVPVTLASFEATPNGGGVHVDWTTATEVGNVGFNILQHTQSGWKKLNEKMIASQNADALAPQSYSFDYYGPVGNAFKLVDVSVTGKRERHGPFKLSETYGDAASPEEIDWAAIKSDKKAARSATLKTKRKAAKAALKAEKAAEASLLSFFSMEALGISSGNNKVIGELSVDAEGIYRVSGVHLAANGIDLTGIKKRRIALLHQGQTVPIRITGNKGKTFAAGNYIEFYGTGIDSLYTRDNVYQLVLDKKQAERMGRDKKRSAKRAVSEPYYMATETVATHSSYNFASPTDDPWVSQSMITYTSPKSWDFDITLDQLVAGADGQLHAGLWGGTDWKEDGDHHVQVSFNGLQIDDKQFDGIADVPVDATVASGLLLEGDNTLSITLPGDTGVAYDLVNLSQFSVTYPRAFVAENGQLAFSGSGEAFTVTGLPERSIVAYRIDDSGVTRLTPRIKTGDTGFSATIRGTRDEARYIIASGSAITMPGIEPVVTDETLTQGNGQYLIISHPDFITGLGDLISKKQAQGLQVKVVDVDDIYTRFGHGIFGPQAIRDYIGYASANLSTEYVLLVGGDTFDYLDYRHYGAESYIPSLYTRTDTFVGFAPVDPLYTDLDGDRVPDLAIGRLPVRTDIELAAVIKKIVNYDSSHSPYQAIFASDEGFGGQSDSLAAMLPNHWSVNKVSLDGLSDIEDTVARDQFVDDARTDLINGMNNGAALASYFGHSSYSIWTFSGLFSADNVAALYNTDRPMLVTQWGCWNTYHVHPRYTTMAHKLLLSGEQGAASVVGATTLTQASSEQALGELVFDRLMQPGMTLGKAITGAKAALAQTNPEMEDVILGWSLLGDPALVVEQ